MNVELSCESIMNEEFWILNWAGAWAALRPLPPRSTFHFALFTFNFPKGRFALPAGTTFHFSLFTFHFPKGHFSLPERTAVRWPMQRAAIANAACCVSHCSALRFSSQEARSAPLSGPFVCHSRPISSRQHIFMANTCLCEQL